MIPFTIADIKKANASWGCNCGPAALAAICGMTLDEVRPHFGPNWPGYTNPTTMQRALDSIHRQWAGIGAPVASSAPWPFWGLCRIQWEGPWMAPNVPAGARYQRTHWVGCHTRGDVRSIWDVNALSDGGADGWALVGDWARRVVPGLIAGVPRASGGWHVTHAIEVERPTGAGS